MMNKVVFADAPVVIYFHGGYWQACRYVRLRTSKRSMKVDRMLLDSSTDECEVRPIHLLWRLFTLALAHKRNAQVCQVLLIC